MLKNIVSAAVIFVSVQSFAATTRLSCDGVARESDTELKVEIDFAKANATGINVEVVGTQRMMMISDPRTSMQQIKAELLSIKQISDWSGYSNFSKAVTAVFMN